MSEPLSWEVIQWALSQLQQCTRANGWHSDIGTYRQISDRMQISDTDPYLLLVALDFAETASASGTSSAQEEMTLLLEFGIPRYPQLTPELAAHRVRADVRRLFRKFRPERSTAPKGLSAFEVVAGSIGDAPDARALTIAQITARAVLGDSYPPAS